jgi:hypothetical protein
MHTAPQNQEGAMAKTTADRDDVVYWPRSKPVYKDIEVWLPEVWSHKFAGVKRRFDRHLAFYRWTGNRLHVIELRQLCLRNNITPPKCVSEMEDIIFEDIKYFADSPRTRRIRDEIYEIVLRPSERSRIGRSIIEEYKTTKRNYLIYQLMSRLNYKEHNDDLKKKQIAARVGKKVGLEYPTVARIYLEIDRMLEEEFQIDTITG